MNTDYAVGEVRRLTPTLAVLDVVDRSLQRYQVVVPYERSDAASLDATVRHTIASYHAHRARVR